MTAIADLIEIADVREAFLKAGHPLPLRLNFSPSLSHAALYLERDLHRLPFAACVGHRNIPHFLSLGLRLDGF